MPGLGTPWALDMDRTAEAALLRFPHLLHFEPVGSEEEERVGVGEGHDHDSHLMTGLGDKLKDLRLQERSPHRISAGGRNFFCRSVRWSGISDQGVLLSLFSPQLFLPLSGPLS